MAAPKVVVLCGSTRFKQAFVEANFRETMAGKIVLSVGWFSHADGHVYAPTEAEKAALDELHLRKIDRADEVLVLNCERGLCGGCGGWFDLPGANPCHCGGRIRPTPYVGPSTRREIDYALAHGKPVRYLEAPPAAAQSPAAGPPS